MKRVLIGNDSNGKIYSIKHKKVDGISFNLIERADTLGDAIYHIERTDFSGWHAKVSRDIKDLNTALELFNVIEYART